MIVAVLILCAMLVFFMGRTIVLEERCRRLRAQLEEATRNRPLWPPQ